MRRPSLVFMAAAAALCTFADADSLRSNDIRTAPLLSTRRVEGYSYLEDVSGYNMIFGKCIRVKDKSNNNDDGEGNSYFVNGRYHAQYTNYASFHLCEDDSNSGTCNSCDLSTEYVTDLDTFLAASTNYIQGLCNACSAYCRRQLEDEEDEEDQDGGGGGGEYNYESLDCSTCSKQCANLNSGGADETEYLECQEAMEEDGIQYYSAPQCDATDNGIIIGLYYDEDCTVKTAQELDYGFSYDTFTLIEESCIDCNDGLCADLYDESLHCVNGYNKNQNADDGGNPVCKTAKSMVDRVFQKRRKQFKFLPILILAVVLAGLLLFGSYTYYVRHKNPLAEPLSSGAGSDLPPIT